MIDERDEETFANSSETFTWRKREREERGKRERERESLDESIENPSRCFHWSDCGLIPF